MAVNKVEVNGETIVDLTGDTVTPASLAKGVTAHDASGAKIEGTMPTGVSYTAGQGISINNGVISAKAIPCNQNLLDNWYFKNPVNQRGQTSYTVTDYAIDRWISQGCTVTLNDGYLTIAGKYLNLDQVVDEYVWKFLRGRTVTISILARGNVAVITEDYAAHYVGLYNNSASFSLASVTLTVRDDASQFVFHIQPQDENAVDIIAVKLELGTEQTLAHQDANGNWVLNEILNYNTELLKCQDSPFDAKYPQTIGIDADGVVVLDESWGGKNILCYKGNSIQFNTNITAALPDGWWCRVYVVNAQTIVTWAATLAEAAIYNFAEGVGYGAAAGGVIVPQNRYIDITKIAWNVIAISGNFADRYIASGTAEPTGGKDGDVYIQYTE